jgi:hypothetical protein
MDYKQFLNYLEKNPFVGNQESCGTGEHYWNADYWTIEVTRYLIEGNKYTVPDKFKGNRNADPNRIKNDALIKLNVLNLLQDIKDSADYLLICEVGRGLDILMASQVKKWKKIYCYDQVDYRNYLYVFDNNINFVRKSTGVFSPETISEKCIVIMNHSICSYEKFKKNMNSVHGIINGDLKW